MTGTTPYTPPNFYNLLLQHFAAANAGNASGLIDDQLLANANGRPPPPPQNALLNMFFPSRYPAQFNALTNPSMPLGMFSAPGA